MFFSNQFIDSFQIRLLRYFGAHFIPNKSFTVYPEIITDSGYIKIEICRINLRNLPDLRNLTDLHILPDLRNLPD